MDGEQVPLALAFAAGIASFLSPCHLAVVPAFLASLGLAQPGAQGPADRWQFVRQAGEFVAGFSLVLIGLGISVGLAGYLLWDWMPWIRKAGGVILVGFGLHTLGLLRLSWLDRDLRFRPAGLGRSGHGAGFVLGLVMGFGWTPCVGPVLAAILLLAATTATVWQGGALLAVYAGGLSVPFLALALLFTRARGIVARLRRYSGVMEIATGLLLIGLGILLYTNELPRVAAYLGTWSPL